jgi:hypothetical protein
MCIPNHLSLAVIHETNDSIMDPLLPGSGYFNLSSVPTYTPSASWQAAAAAWRANQTELFKLVESISVAVCSPKYTLQPWIVDLVNGSTTPVELQWQNVRNIDPTQLNIAIQDCFNRLPTALPISILFNTSIAQLSMLFTVPTNSSFPGIHYLAENLTELMNPALPSFVQAYLDSFPFGNFTPPSPQLLIPAVILLFEIQKTEEKQITLRLLSHVRSTHSEDADRRNDETIERPKKRRKYC